MFWQNMRSGCPRDGWIAREVTGAAGRIGPEGVFRLVVGCRLPAGGRWMAELSTAALRRLRQVVAAPRVVVAPEAGAAAPLVTDGGASALAEATGASLQVGYHVHEGLQLNFCVVHPAGLARWMLVPH